MNLIGLAQALGGSVSGHNSIRIAGPGHSKKNPGLIVFFDPNAPDGFRTFSHYGGCEHEDHAYVKSLLAKMQQGLAIFSQSDLGLKKALTDLIRVKAASAVWDSAFAIPCTIGEVYLAGRRCWPASVATIGGALRFHPLCPFGSERVPALVALMADVISGKPTGIHRTALKDDGSGKRIMADGASAKRMRGIAKGAVVMLGHAAQHMGLAEGIETALSAARIFNLPVWATLSAGGIANIPVIPGVKHLTVCADHDQAGLTAAKQCARRYQRAGINVTVRYPEIEGTDWNDWLRHGE